MIILESFKSRLDSVPVAIWWGLVGFSLVILVVSLLVTPHVIGRMPADYFLPSHVAPDASRNWALLIARNVLGWTIFIAGTLMCFVPGQGLLTMLIGLTLVNFPGKRRLESTMFAKSATLRKALNWIRRKTDAVPFEASDV